MCNRNSERLIATDKALQVQVLPGQRRLLLHVRSKSLAPACEVVVDQQEKQLLRWPVINGGQGRASHHVLDIHAASLRIFTLLCCLIPLVEINLSLSARTTCMMDDWSMRLQFLEAPHHLWQPSHSLSVTFAHVCACQSKIDGTIDKR